MVPEQGIPFRRNVRKLVLLSDTQEIMVQLAFYRYPDLQSFIREHWEARFLESWDANDMVVLFNTWQQGDVSFVRHGGDLEKCLREIKAKGLIMPSKTDLYFPVGIFTSPSNRSYRALAEVDRGCSLRTARTRWQ